MRWIFNLIFLQGETDRLINLERNIDQGKSLQDAAERDLHKFWDAFRSAKTQFENFFDSLICSAPDQLKTIWEEMKKLAEKVSMFGYAKI